ncbi:MAG: thioredoxin [Dehalococcoidia bacterium]
MTAHSSTFVFDVDEQSFQTAVLDRSRTVPVVVDFWAPWCGPCRQLGPILERLAMESGGQFELAKLNTDENPNISQSFGIQGIPHVIAFKDGKPANQFTGALPEPQVRAFVAKLLPSEADRLTEQGEELAAAGHFNAAEDAFRAALQKQAVHPRAAVGLARILAERGEPDEAEALRVLSSYPNDAQANQLRASIGLRKAGAESGGDRRALEERVANTPQDVAARYELGLALAAEGQQEQALLQLLEVVKLDRAFNDDAGRKSMVDLFSVLGEESPLTQTYRKKLGYLLF